MAAFGLKIEFSGFKAPPSKGPQSYLTVSCLLDIQGRLLRTSSSMRDGVAAKGQR
jgi:hypothetical protein